MEGVDECLRIGSRDSPRGDLRRDEPAKGLKRIAVCGAAEQYDARTKDWDALAEAIRAKLTAQAEFLFWCGTPTLRSSIPVIKSIYGGASAGH